MDIYFGDQTSHYSQSISGPVRGNQPGRNKLKNLGRVAYGYMGLAHYPVMIQWDCHEERTADDFAIDSIRMVSLWASSPANRHLVGHHLEGLTVSTQVWASRKAPEVV